jgi:hypothetical protein
MSSFEPLDHEERASY